MSFHSEVTTGAVHIVYNWSYANDAARQAATGFVAADVGKVSIQTNDNTLWLLVDTTPTWVPISGAMLGQLDGYVSDITFQEFKSQYSQVVQSLTQADDGYQTQINGMIGTETEHYTQLSEAIDSLRQAADAYGSGGTEIEHWNQQQQINQSILQALDGYAQNSTTTEHYAQLSTVIDLLRQAADGYQTQISGIVNTEIEHYNQHSQALQDIILSLDGYSTPPGGVSETTFQENKNAQEQINQSIIQALDGYGGGSGPVVGVGEAEDGYGGHFTGGTTNGHGLYSTGTGDGYGGIFKGGTGYAGFFQATVSSPRTAALRIVPQIGTPQSAEAGDLYINTPDIPTHLGMRKLRIFNGKEWDRYVSVSLAAPESETVTTTADFTQRYLLPAGSLRVGDIIRIYTSMDLTSYSSGTIRYEGYINGYASGTLLWQSTTATPAINWQWIAEHTMVITATGTSGILNKTGTTVFGASSAVSSVCPNVVAGVAINTTIDNYITPSTAISGTMTARLVNFIVSVY